MCDVTLYLCFELFWLVGSGLTMKYCKIIDKMGLCSLVKKV